MHFPLESTYFAYGSNMDRNQMSVRCPESREIGVAKLPNFEFQIYDRGYANVIPKPGSLVWGTLWNLTESDWERLDRYEGTRFRLYSRGKIGIEIGNESYQVQTYFATNDQPGIPGLKYMENILWNSKERDFPEDYQKFLKNFLPL